MGVSMEPITTMAELMNEVRHAASMGDGGEALPVSVKLLETLLKDWEAARAEDERAAANGSAWRGVRDLAEELAAAIRVAL